MEFKSRRKFVKNVVSTSAFFAIMNPLELLFSFKKEKVNSVSWNELIDWARWCPSIHNLQPHKIKVISEHEADLYYDPSRLLPVGDPNCVFATVAMGVFIEHLSIAAGHHGAEVIVDEVFDPISTKYTSLTKFARIKIVESNRKENLSRDLIKKRMTSRGHYNGKQISTEILEKIKNQSNEFDHEFFHTFDDKLIREVIKMNQETLFEDLESKENRNELHNLFRYTTEDAEIKKDGLWAKCMGFPGKLMKSVFVNHERWEKGVRRKLLSEYYENSFNGTSTICWIGGAFENTNDWLNSGKMLARIWLLFTQEGIYIHPFGSLITNKKAYATINKLFSQAGHDKKLWLIFRAGYSKEPARSYRLSTNEIII
jgi:hypothetical protein